MQVHCQTRLKETTQEEQGSHRHVCPSSSTNAPGSPPATTCDHRQWIGHTTRLTQAAVSLHAVILTEGSRPGSNAPVGDQEICTPQMNIHMMTVNKISRNRPKNRLWLHHHTTMSLVVRLKKTLLMLLEDNLVLLLGLGDPGLRWVFSDPVSSSNFDCSICDWECEFFTFIGVNTSFALSFWRGVLMRPSPPILQCLRPQCLLSRFLPRFHA